MSTASYISYFLLVLALVYSPGPMTLFLMANGMRSQMKQVYPVLLGANHAYLFAIVIFSIGLAELLQQHQVLFKCIQIIGIIYLLYLAALQWRKKTLSIMLNDASDNKQGKMSLYGRGALVALSNPKTILLFTIVFPQFAVRGEGYYFQIFILGATFLVLQFSSGCFYAYLGSHIKNVIQQSHYQLLINKASAFVLFVVAIFLIMRF